MKRKWVVRTGDPSGAERWLVITVPEGEGVIHASVGTTSITWRPEDIARLQRAYSEARAAVLWDRGQW